MSDCKDHTPCSTPAEIKALPLEGKIEVFRSLLTNVHNENEVDILNVFRLVNSYNTFDEEFFEQDASYISDIVEFIEIKSALTAEIDAFILVLITWYLSIIASCEIPLTIEQDDSKKKIPALIYGIFVLGSAPLLASLMNKVDLGSIDMRNLYQVKEGFSVFSRFLGNQALVGALLEKM